MEVGALEDLDHLLFGGAQLDRAAHVLLEAGAVAADCDRRTYDHLAELRRQRALADRSQLVDALVGLEEVDVDLPHEAQPVGHEAAPPLAFSDDCLRSFHWRPFMAVSLLKKNY